jgi:hypothetical protein
MGKEILQSKQTANHQNLILTLTARTMGVSRTTKSLQRMGYQKVLPTLKILEALQRAITPQMLFESLTNELMQRISF